MPVARRALGDRGERLAEDALLARGWRVVARKWRCPLGEIDLVAVDGDCYVFAEVKTRHSHGVELPEDALTPLKARRLVALAQAYLGRHRLDDVDWRIDLIAVELGAGGSLARLEVISGVATED